jgi:hypothetical protein
MKTKFFFGMLMLVIAFVDGQYRKMNNFAFSPGEKLYYIAYFDSYVTGKIKAGFGIAEVLPTLEEIGGRKCYHVSVYGSTFKKYEWAIYVNDRFDSYIDEEGLFPWMFLRRAHEGRFKANQDIYFNHNKGLAQFKDNVKNRTVTYEVPQYVQDMISAAYYARNLDITNLKVGESIQIPFVFEDSLYTTTIIYQGVKTIKTSLGKFEALAFKPRVLTGNVFGEAYPLTLYFSNDNNRILLYATSSILIGNVKFELVDYKNLRYPLNKK